MRCTDLCENEENITYNWFFDDVSTQVKAAKDIDEKIKNKGKVNRRGDMRENGKPIWTRPPECSVILELIFVLYLSILVY
jgi:hypothetical protein